MNVSPDEGYLSVWEVLGFIICFCLKDVTGQKIYNFLLQVFS